MYEHSIYVSSSGAKKADLLEGSCTLGSVQVFEGVAQSAFQK